MIENSIETKADGDIQEYNTSNTKARTYEIKSNQKQATTSSLGKKVSCYHYNLKCMEHHKGKAWSNNNNDCANCFRA